VYAPQSSAGATPTAVISGASAGPEADVTKLGFPNGIALDSHGNIYVTDDRGTIGHGSNVDAINVYPAGSKDNAKPSSSVAGAETGLHDPYGVAVDATGTIYVANFQGGPSMSGSVTSYAPGSTGDAKPRASIVGPDTGLHDPFGIVVDCKGDIYVANYEGGPVEAGSITVYRHDSDGNAKPIRTIAGGNTGLRQPHGIALDPGGNIYVANYTGGPSESGSITVYPAGSNGNVAPGRAIAGPSTGIDHPWGIATRPYECSSPKRPVANR
jgi:sugar lactone lactonase YvrE